MTFSARTTEFTDAISASAREIKILRSELKLNETEMSNSGESAELLEKKHSLLASELTATQKKSENLTKKLEHAKEIFGENSQEVAYWTVELNRAKGAELGIENSIESVNAEMAQQKKKTSELSTAMSVTDGKIEELNSELKLNSANLEIASDKTDLLKERSKLLNQQFSESKDKVSLLEKELNKCGNEVDDNSEEYAELKKKLSAAKIEQAEIQKEINDTTQQLKKQKKAVSDVGEGFKKAGDKLDTVADKTRVVSAMATGALVGAGLVAVEFESAFAGVKKTNDEVFDGNGKLIYSYQDLEEGIRNLAKEIPASTTEISAVAEAAGQLGIKTEDILGFTSVMIDMGESTNLASEDAASSLAKFANITGLALDDSMSAEERYGKLGSTIVALGNNMATTEADIVNMSTRLAASGELAGLSETEILALSASMSAVGIEVEAGGTAMSATMSEIESAVATGGKSLEQFASVAGVSSDDFATMWKEKPMDAIQAFIGGLGGLDEKGESATIVLDEMGLSAIRQSNMLKSLALSSEGVAEAADLASEAWEEGSALSDEAAKRYETTSSKLSIMKNHVRDAGISLGTVLLPPLVKVAEKISKFAEKISGLSEVQKKFLIGILAVVASLSTIFTVLAVVSHGLGAILSLAGTLSTAMAAAGITGAAAMSAFVAPIAIAVAAVAGLIGIFVLLWTKCEDFRAFFTGIWTFFSDVIKGFLETFNFAEKIEALKSKFSGLGEKLQGLSDLFKIAGSIISVLIIPPLAMLSGLFGAIMAIINFVITAIGNLINMLAGLGQFIVGVFTGDVQKASAGLSLFINGAVGLFVGLWTSIYQILLGFLSGIASFFYSLLSRCGVVQFAKGVYDTLVDKFVLAKDKVLSVIDAIKNAFNFSWSLPKIKLPSVSVTGKFSLDPISVPKFSIKWNSEGAILRKPTIFGMNNGMLQGGGEAGMEAVLPIEKLYGFIEDALTNVLGREERELQVIDYDRLAMAIANVKISTELNGRELIRWIKEELQ